MRENPDIDLVSDLLALVRARTALSGGLRAGGAWAIAFPATPQVKFWGIRHGCAWIDVGDGVPLAARAGDVFLFHAPGAHTLSSAPGLPAVPLEAVARGRTGAVLRHGEVGDDDADHDHADDNQADFFMIGGKVDLDVGCAPLLFGGLPPVMRLAGDAPGAPSIHWVLDRLVAERDAGLPGSAAACAQLAQLMLVDILRAHLADPARLGSGCFRALADPRLAPALRMMHGAPGHGWRLADLAGACAMSRAGFADHFKRVAGVPPLHYLAELRMRLASRRLRGSDDRLARVAAEFGYASESAFSHAFKRVMGCAPATFRLAGASHATEDAAA